MPITVVTPATKVDFTTEGELALFLGLTSEERNQNQQLLNDIIAGVSAFITRYTGRTFPEEVVKESFSSTVNQYRLILTRRPVTTITSVSFRGTVVNATDYLLEDPDAGFLLRTVGCWTPTNFIVGPIEPHPARIGLYDWEVSYTGGYKMAGHITRNLPRDIELACLDIAKQWYLTRDADPTIVREQVGNSVIWRRGYKSGDVDVPISLPAKEILDRYVEV